MLPAELDATLARFVAAVDVMTTNLLELEANPTNKLLEPASLTGVTQAQVAGVRQTLLSLWEHFTEFKALVERAHTRRGTSGHLPQSRLQELEALLMGPSIALPPIDVPLDRRGLYTPSQMSVATTPDELLRSMGAAFDAVKKVVLAVDEAWRALVPRVSAAQDELAALTNLAATLAETDVSLDRVRTRVDALSRQVGRDPLAIKAEEFDQVEATLASVRARLDQLSNDRQALDRDLEHCAEQIDEIAVTIDQGEKALNETRIKVLDPEGLLAPLHRSCLTDPARGLAPWLERLRDFAREGNWRNACRGVDQWGRLADETLSAARRVAEANAAPLQLRNELRGRLDALAAKAERLGLTEDPDLSALLEQARAVLFTAPSDLVLANRLVTEYGASLTGGTPERASSS